MHEQPPSGCTRTPEAAGAPPPGFISGSPLARQHGPSHAGLLRGRVARATERTFVRARSSHALPTAAQTPPAPNGCADGGGRSSPSPGALRQQSQRPRFSPAVRRLSHLILARLGTVFRAPREGPDPALQPGRQTAAPADGRGVAGTPGASAGTTADTSPRAPRRARKWGGAAGGGGPPEAARLAPPAEAEHCPQRPPRDGRAGHTRPRPRVRWQTAGRAEPLRRGPGAACSPSEPGRLVGSPRE